MRGIKADPAVARSEMVHRLERLGFLRDPRVARAMGAVPRHLFVPEDLAAVAYVDEPLPLGKGQTISAPHMVAMMLEAIDLWPGQRVLEVGTGSGYHAALAARLVAPGGLVFTLERIPELAERAEANFRASGAEGVEVVVGDGSLGLPDRAPFDRILVTAASPSTPPPLVEQLAVGGRLIIPIGSPYSQDLVLLEKDEKGVHTTDLGGCAFVPLVGRYGFGQERGWT